MFAVYKSHNNSLYNKLIELSRNIFFYKKLHLKDNFLTRINLIFIHFSLILIIFKNKKAGKFPQNIFDNIFQNIEYNLRELGHGDVAVNKKMKLLTQKFYDILLKIGKDKNGVFQIDKNILKKHLEFTEENKDDITDKLAVYFEKFYKFCFELPLGNMIRDTLNFKN